MREFFSGKSLPVEGRGKSDLFGSRKFRVQGHDARHKGVEAPHDEMLLRILASESDRWHHQPLYEAS